MSAPPAPEAAHSVFGTRISLAQQYAQILAEAGTAQGLLGPREVPRLWDRHLLNCAVVGDLIPGGVRVVDVGSGAGLPGVALAIGRPDLRVELIEPMERRVRFLIETVTALGMRDTVRVTRGRAPDVAASIEPAPWVVARAVAPLVRLVPQCLPLMSPGGRLLAMKGAQAADELAAVRESAARRGLTGMQVLEVGSEVVAEPTRVVLFCRHGRGNRSGSKGAI